MKKIIMILSLVLVLSSCNFMDRAIDSMTYDLLESVHFSNLEDYDLSRISSFHGIGSFIQHHVTYKEDRLEDFQSPLETLQKGTGDCDDYAILFMCIAKIVFDIEMELIIVNTNNRTIVEGGIGNHMDVYYNGVIYSAQWGYEIAYTPILYKYTFDEVFY